jgi:hypothetical protein
MVSVPAGAADPAVEPELAGEALVLELPALVFVPPELAAPELPEPLVVVPELEPQAASKPPAILAAPNAPLAFNNQRRLNLPRVSPSGLFSDIPSPPHQASTRRQDATCPACRSQGPPQAITCEFRTPETVGGQRRHLRA